MAARRLVIVMLVLLGVSAGLAALVPQREPGEGGGSSETGPSTEGESTTEAESNTEGQTTTPPDVGEEGPLTFDIKIGGPKRPVVPIELGQSVSLIVRSQAAAQVEIPELGLIEAVGPGAPARFELLPSETGSLGVLVAGEDRLVARIEVRPEARAGSGPPGSKTPRERDRS